MRANPTFSPPPTDSRDSVSVQTCRVSPPLSCGCAAHSGVSTRSRVLWDCRTLCPDIYVEADDYSEQDARPPPIPESCEVVWYVDISSGHHNAQWSTTCFHQDAAFGPGLASVCWIPSDLIPPQTSLAHRGVSRLPLPVHTTQLIAVCLDNGPDPGGNPGRFPPLESAMDGAVLAQTLRKPVPLAARAHSKDDCVEHLTRIFSLASGPLWRIEFSNLRLNLLP